ncbi:MAG: RNA polymerase sigma factor, partial [Acidobacteria bacterium]|nr:RNA polymerase sigma factor [Acidobacteriota bacterium]
HDDHEAFAELVRLHQSAVRRFLGRLVGHDRARADDLAQETFWRAYRHLATFQARGRFLSWLFRIAFQVFVTDRRTLRHLPEPLPDALASPVNEVDTVVNRRAVEQVLMHLTPAERAAIVLHYQHGMSHAEIAEALEFPLGTVKTLIRRGRQSLQHTFGKTSHE